MRKETIIGVVLMLSATMHFPTNAQMNNDQLRAIKAGLSGALGTWTDIEKQLNMARSMWNAKRTALSSFDASDLDMRLKKIERRKDLLDSKPSASRIF